MTTAQERLRRAINATAEQITADSVPPFRAPEPARRFAVEPWPGPRRLPRWLAPVAAAASIAIIAAGVLVISNVVAVRPRPADLTGKTVPPYYVALTKVAHSSRVDVTVRSTATARALATVSNPAPYSVFNWVTAAADDRTFVIAAAKSQPPSALGIAPVRLYLLRFNPAGDTTRMTELPIRNVMVDDRAVNLTIALSPDGAHLAVVTNTFPGIRVYSLRTGAQHAWVAAPTVLVMAPSWADDSRTLAYNRVIINRGYDRRTFGVYLLDTANPARTLLSASRKVPNIIHPFPYSGSYSKIEPAGSAIVSPVGYIGAKAVRFFIGQISVRTGRLLRRFTLHGTDQTPEVVWVSRSGTPLVVLTNPSVLPYQSTQALLVTGRRVTKIPWPAAISHFEFPAGQPVAW
jgi:hypothetical protein